MFSGEGGTKHVLAGCYVRVVGFTINVCGLMKERELLMNSRTSQMLDQLRQ